MRSFRTKAPYPHKIHVVDPPNDTQLSLELFLALPYIFQFLHSHWPVIFQDTFVHCA
uniref:KPRO n=1 Tax=Arundo donax TaxID=35708 RepID=A0A0A9A6C6_ARUDO